MQSARLCRLAVAEEVGILRLRVLVRHGDAGAQGGRTEKVGAIDRSRAVAVDLGRQVAPARHLLEKPGRMGPPGKIGGMGEEDRAVDITGPNRTIGRERELNDNVRERGKKALRDLITDNDTWSELKTLAHYAVIESREHQMPGKNGEWTWYENFLNSPGLIETFARNRDKLRQAVAAYRAMKAKERERVRKGGARKSVLDKQAQWFADGIS